MHLSYCKLALIEKKNREAGRAPLGESAVRVGDRENADVRCDQADHHATGPGEDAWQ